MSKNINGISIRKLRSVLTNVMLIASDGSGPYCLSENERDIIIKAVRKESNMSNGYVIVRR